MINHSLRSHSDIFGRQLRSLKSKMLIIQLCVNVKNKSNMYSSNIKLNNKIRTKLSGNNVNI